MDDMIARFDIDEIIYGRIFVYIQNSFPVIFSCNTLMGSNYCGIMILYRIVSYRVELLMRSTLAPSSQASGIRECSGYMVTVSPSAAKSPPRKPSYMSGSQFYQARQQFLDIYSSLRWIFMASNIRYIFFGRDTPSSPRPLASTILTQFTRMSSPSTDLDHRTLPCAYYRTNGMPRRDPADIGGLRTVRVNWRL